MQIRASYKGIWEIAYPIMLGSLAQNIIGLTDTIFLGRVGEVEQGAGGLVSIYYLVMVMIGLALSRGGQILIARRAGEKQYDEISNITHNLLYFELLLASILFVFLTFGSSHVLWLFIKSPEIYEASLSYLSYRSYGIFFSFFGFVLMALYTAIGRTKIIIWITGILCITNVFFNYGLIFGAFGLPEMSIAGAGLASTIAEIVSTIAGIIYIVFDKDLKNYSLFAFQKINKNVLSRISSLSIPLILQYIIGLGGWFIFFTFIEKMGERALAISVVLKMIYTFYSIPAWGFASAANSIVSNIIGQKKYKQVYIAINRTAILSFIFTIIPCLTLMLFPGTILAVFTKDMAVIQGATPVLFIIIAITLACSISIVIFNGVMGTGATKVSLGIETIAVIVYLAYAYSVVNLVDLGLEYVWGSEFLYWVVMASFAWLYLQSGRWKDIKV